MSLASTDSIEPSLFLPYLVEDAKERPELGFDIASIIESISKDP
jgi:hypothetical protein